MTNDEMIQNINDWQECDVTHEMTCGNDSSHKPLYPVEEDGKIIMKCHDCDWSQEHIPKCVLNFDKEKANKFIEGLGINVIREPKGKEKNLF